MPYRLLRKKGDQWVKTFMKSSVEKEMQILVQHINRLTPMKGRQIEATLIEYDWDEEPSPEPTEPTPEPTEPQDDTKYDEEDFVEEEVVEEEETEEEEKSQPQPTRREEVEEEET